MWTDLVKYASKWQLQGICGISGFIFVYLCYFSGFPSQSNNWIPPLRTPPHYGLLTVGCIIIFCAIVLLILPKQLLHNNNHEKEIVGTKKGLLSFVSSDPNLHPIVLKYWKLPKTQKEIVVFLYEHSTKDRVLMDSFFTALEGNNGPDFLASEDELFYRLKVLKFEEFLDLDADVPKSTYVIKITKVRKALRNADIINT